MSDQNDKGVLFIICTLLYTSLTRATFMHSFSTTHYVWFSWFWSHLKMSKIVLLVAVRLPQRLKSMFFEKFSHSTGPFGAAPFKFFFRTLILVFEANSLLSRENETKIVKITHSALHVNCPAIISWLWQLHSLENWS